MVCRRRLRVRRRRGSQTACLRARLRWENGGSEKGERGSERGSVVRTREAKRGVKGVSAALNDGVSRVFENRFGERGIPCLHAVDSRLQFYSQLWFQFMLRGRR